MCLYSVDVANRGVIDHRRRQLIEGGGSGQGNGLRIDIAVIRPQVERADQLAGLRIVLRLKALSLPRLQCDRLEAGQVLPRVPQVDLLAVIVHPALSERQGDFRDALRWFGGGAGSMSLKVPSSARLFRSVCVGTSVRRAHLGH